MHRAWLLALLVLIPSVSAADVHLRLPDEGSALAPLIGGYTLGEGPYEGHVDIKMQFWMGGYLLLETPSIHEHDGVHTFAFTPPAAGTLHVVAYRDGAIAASKNITITEAGPSTVEAVQLVVGANSASAPAAQQRVLIDVDDPQDGLVLSTWIADEPFLFNLDGRTVHATAVARDGTQRGMLQESKVGTASTIPLPYLFTNNRPACTGEVVMDPTTMQGGVPAFQAGSDIRITYPDATGPVNYVIRQAPVEVFATQSPIVYHDVTVNATMAPLTVQLPATGPHELIALHDGASCSIRFLMTPASSAAAGTVEGQLVANPSGMDLTFTPLDATGAKIGHYEFDTRIYHLADPANSSLVWMGKMHGHAGPVTLRLYNMPEGDYRAVTYPSPQSLDAPVVAGSFSFDFSIQHQNLSVDVASGALPPWLAQAPVLESTETGKESPGLSLLLLGAAFVLLARRRQS